MQNQRNAGVVPMIPTEPGIQTFTEEKVSPPKVVRAKMRCTQVISHDGGWQTIKFSCQYDQSKEDQGFSETTPSGQAEFTLSKKTLIGHYIPGKCYYFDVLEAD